MNLYDFHIDKARYERKFVIEGMSVEDITQIINLHPANFHRIFNLRQVNNIYLDTAELKYYNDNVIGADHRMKIRIRWYGDLKGMIKRPILEIKLKNGLLGNKHSYPLTSFKVDWKLSQQSLLDVFIKSNLPEVVLENLKSLAPVLLNTYIRRYLQSFDKIFRFTIDDQLNYYNFSQMGNAFLNNFKNQREKILELKYHAEFNELAKSISNELPFRMSKSSKYVNGVDHYHNVDLFE